MFIQSSDINNNEIQYEETESNPTSSYDKSDQIDENNQINESDEEGSQSDQDDKKKR